MPELPPPQRPAAAAAAAASTEALLEVGLVSAAPLDPPKNH
eukprot:CAMPEP_0171783202 /NCGR_PEP_ID=MMETSP0991-20121206/61339_1 /TAXON_ID=483369 /ORGANISM="non described non described, Strain CCMP2098" /LENGTH=40 /DNA_ID= /DNA_START= /DNA_END= /DNA_ORIENTATION=